MPVSNSKQTFTVSAGKATASNPAALHLEALTMDAIHLASALYNMNYSAWNSLSNNLLKLYHCQYI